MYIFVFGAEPRAVCVALLEKVASKPKWYQIRISRTILEEVRRNIPPRRFKDFWLFLKNLGVPIDEDWEVPFELGIRYETIGLKQGDAFIAAYTEWTGASYLILQKTEIF